MILYVRVCVCDDIWGVSVPVSFVVPAETDRINLPGFVRKNNSSLGVNHVHTQREYLAPSELNYNLQQD